MDPLEGRTLGPYLLERQLGGGGMASVYRGRHRVLDRVRAVKVMSIHLAAHEGFVRLFYREARLAAQLDHPNVVHIYDVSEQDGFPYIVMDLLEGRSLRGVIHEDQPLTLARAVHFVQQLAAALDHAHQHEIAHRDIKPTNAFVSPNDHLTLVDFGIARAAGSTRLTVTHGIGTPEYMAPESFDEELSRPGADDHTLGVDADLYALGIVAYELLTGRLPFGGRTPQSVAFAHVHHDPPPLRSHRPDLSELVEAVVLRQLSKDPRQRFGPAGAFASALDDAARPDIILSEAEAALDRGDLEQAEHRLTDTRVVGLNTALISHLRRGIAERRARQQQRIQVDYLLDRGDWRTALHEIRLLEEDGEEALTELTERAEVIRAGEVVRAETERRQAAERQEKERRAVEAATAPRETIIPATPNTPVNGNAFNVDLSRKPSTTDGSIDLTPAGQLSVRIERWRWLTLVGLIVLALAGGGFFVLSGLLNPSRPSPTVSAVAAAPTLTTSQALLLTPPTAEANAAPTATLVPVPATATLTPPKATAAPAFATAIPLTLTPSPDQRLASARNALDGGDFPRALEVLDSLRQTVPNAPGLDDALYDAHLRYGRSLFESQQLDASWGEFEAALAVRPNNQVAEDGKRQIIVMKNWQQMETSWNANPDSAISALEAILQIDPEYRAGEARQKLYALLIAKADRLLNTGDRDGAFPVLLRAREILPAGDEATSRLVSYTPTPTAVPTPRPVPPTSPPAPKPQTSPPQPQTQPQPAAPAPRPAPAPQPQAQPQPAAQPAPAPAAPAATATKVPFTPPGGR